MPEKFESEALADMLQGGLSALSLDVAVDQRDKLLKFLALLHHWNGTYNLTAVRDPGDMLSHHLLDCLAVVPALRSRVPAGAKVLDVGSGGGLPGVVLAVLQPTWVIDCVDAVGKKAAFIRQVSAELGLGNLRSLHARVETVQGAYDLVISRAFSSLGQFVALTRHLLGDGGLWAAMKGKLRSVSRGTTSGPRAGGGAVPGVAASSNGGS
jgi:16S rRNA (guanine527-N7)-methyltransferase